MHISSLIPFTLLSLASAQYTQILTSAIAGLSGAVATLTVHSGPAYESALAQAESGYAELTGLLYANPSLSSQYGSLIGVYASELSAFETSSAAAATITNSLSSAISSVTSSASSVTSSAIASTSASGTSGADVVSVSVMGVLGPGLLGVAAWL
jgi:hypothetical protein